MVDKTNKLVLAEINDSLWHSFLGQVDYTNLSVVWCEIFVR